MKQAYDIKELLPQKGRMALLDELIDANEDSIVSSLTVRNDGLLNSLDNTVPAWIGIEYMAQTIAAYSGYHAKIGGRPITVGFLLGTRKFSTSIDRISCGTKLKITAVKILQDENGMAVFDCRVEGSGIRQDAKINVFQPKDFQKFLEENIS